MSHPLGNKSVIYIGTSELGYSVDHRNDIRGMNRSDPHLTREGLVQYLMDSRKSFPPGRDLDIVNGVPEEKIIYRTPVILRLSDDEFSRILVESSLGRISPAA